MVPIGRFALDLIAQFFKNLADFLDGGLGLPLDQP